MREPKAGEHVGAWELVERIDRGGNSWVWKVRCEDGSIRAMKILRRTERDRLDRFRDEIAFLLAGDHGPGVLPLLDHNLAEGGETPWPWYVMPLAVPMDKALGPDRTVDDVLLAVGGVANTLADLASREVGHRDIKPENLFRLDGRWVVGDFGLVSYPDKSSRTIAGERLGPLDFMAPEMRANADTARAERADVYALAKTTWSLLTGEEPPPLGPHRIDDPEMALRGRVSHPRVEELDLLLERATRYRPDDRLTMHGFAEELAVVIQPAPEISEAPDTEALIARINALQSGPDRERERGDRDIRPAAAALHELNVDGLSAVANAHFNRLSGLGVKLGPGFGFHTLCFPHTPLPGQIHQEGWTAIVVDRSGGEEIDRLLAAVGMELTEEGVVRLTAGYALIEYEGGSPRPGVIWLEQREAPVDSVALARAKEDLIAGLHTHIDAALAALARRLSDR